jgi:hypothetical protein
MPPPSYYQKEGGAHLVETRFFLLKITVIQRWGHTTFFYIRNCNSAT